MNSACNLSSMKIDRRENELKVFQSDLTTEAISYLIYIGRCRREKRLRGLDFRPIIHVFFIKILFERTFRGRSGENLRIYYQHSQA